MYGVHSTVFAIHFFLTKYFRAKKENFENEKKNISKHFFYEKMVPILFIFHKKNILTKKYNFSKIKNLPFLAFFDLLWL